MDQALSAIDKDSIESAQVVLTCNELEPSLTFFTETLGFRVEAIFPADDPSVAVLAGHGVRLRLEPGAEQPGPVLRLFSNSPAIQKQEHNDPGNANQSLHRYTAPNGTRIEVVPARRPIRLPALAPAFVLRRLSADADWKTGRAGMRYRDLIPDRQGGRVIASHIAIPEGGTVPDYVHFHKIRFQMIYCRRGWVRVVYEDQGEPFVLNAGDCVLQPPEIRHRVLESSPGLEVIEIGSPAEHETYADPTLTLPTERLLPARDFGGQRFARHHAANASYSPWRIPGFVYRDSGIAAATDGLASVRTVRPQEDSGATASEPHTSAMAEAWQNHADELLFFFVLEGNITLQTETLAATVLNSGDAITLPAGLGYRLSSPSSGLELLEVIIHGAAEPVTV